MDLFLDHSQGDEEITIEYLRRSVVNEITCPELLPYERSMMDHFNSLLKEVRSRELRFLSSNSQNDQQI
jgi:hypothetical protein